MTGQKNFRISEKIISHVLEVESKGSNIVNGVAASYYGVSNVGAALHRSKYEKGGDFPDFLLKLSIESIQEKIWTGEIRLSCLCSSNFIRRLGKELRC